MEKFFWYKISELDAFIYDAVVLDYLVGEDNDCGLLTVGSWYAMTGYGFAMPKNSKYLEKFNKKMIEYRENGMCVSRCYMIVFVINFFFWFILKVI